MDLGIDPLTDCCEDPKATKAAIDWLLQEAEALKAAAHEELTEAMSSVAVSSKSV